MDPGQGAQHIGICPRVIFCRVGSISELCDAFRSCCKPNWNRPWTKGLLLTRSNCHEGQYCPQSVRNSATASSQPAAMLPLQRND